MSSRASSIVRPQDVLLAILFVVMAVIAPQRDPSEVALILLLGALQITETRFIQFDTTRWKVLWNLLKLCTGYLLIGYTGGVNSPYYLVLLFPVISAAASLGVLGTLTSTALSCGAYLSFLLYVDWNVFHIDPEQIAELERRLLILALIGLLVNTLAERVREQSLRYKSLAEQLADANRHLRDAEAQVRRSERLAALGQLTAGVAHELRNPLSIIRGSAEMLGKHVSQENAIAREVAGFISSEVDRTNSLVSRFLDFARPLQLRLARADLNQIVDQAVAAAAGDAATQEVTIRKTEFPGPLEFALDAELMERVLFNLVQNAIQASPRGSSILVATGRQEREAEVRVIDRGAGVAAEQIETIFNPFVTTKPGGTGLGLAIVAKIVDEHGGRVRVESRPGEGATFVVTLPMENAA